MKKLAKQRLRLAPEILRPLTAAQTAGVHGGQFYEATAFVTLVWCGGGGGPDTAYANTCAATQAPPCL